MNTKQLRLIQFSSIIIIGMCLFPPVQINGIDQGYSFIGYFKNGLSINISKILLQLLAILTFSVMAWFQINENKEILYEKTIWNKIKSFTLGKEKLWIAFWIVGVIGNLVFITLGAYSTEIRNPILSSSAFYSWRIYVIWSLFVIAKCSLNTNIKIWSYITHFIVAACVLYLIVIFSDSLAP